MCSRCADYARPFTWRRHEDLRLKAPAEQYRTPDVLQPSGWRRRAAKWLNRAGNESARPARHPFAWHSFRGCLRTGAPAAAARSTLRTKGRGGLTLPNGGYLEWRRGRETMHTRPEHEYAAEAPAIERCGSKIAGLPLVR